MNPSRGMFGERIQGNYVPQLALVAPLAAIQFRHSKYSVYTSLAMNFEKKDGRASPTH